MKLNKKFLACFMAATMAIAPMTAFGDSTSSQFDVNGTVTNTNLVAYNVILPTSESVNFNVDPYGILNRGDGYGLDNVLTSIASGEAGIVTSSATAIINKSSVDINVKISAYVTASGVTINLADSKQDAIDNSKDLYLAIANVSGATVSVTNAATFVQVANLTGDSTDLVESVYVPSGNAISVTGGTLELTPAAILANSSSSMTEYNNIKLNNIASAYQLSGTAFVLSEGAVNYNVGNSYAFAITGYANPKSDIWEKLTDSGSLQLTLKFDISTDEIAGGSNSSDPFANLTVAKGRTSDLTITTTKQVDSLVINSYPGAPNANAGLTASRQFTSTTTSLTILGSYIKGWTDTGNYVFTATYSDGTTQTFTIKCQ